VSKPYSRAPLFKLGYGTGLLSPSRVPNVAGRELVWLGLRIVGILKIFYSRAVLQRTVVDFPAFFRDRTDGKDGGCAHTTRLPKSRRIGGIFSEL
jgi:hypothetical protein